MSRVRLLHWNAAEAAPTIELLTRAGFQVEYDPAYSSALMREWRAHPPSAFVIDLSRLPSHGKEVAIALRQSPKTKQVPIIFCGGSGEKVNSLREALPDAAYCQVKGLVKALKSARALDSPVQPAAMMKRYGGRTTAQKLGIGEGTSVAAVNPPRNLSAVLGELPNGVEFTEHAARVTLYFIHSVDDLRLQGSRARALEAQSKLWIVWRKKGAPDHNGVTDRLVRNTALDLGLVDYKICSLDRTWTGMLFARKKA